MNAPEKIDFGFQNIPIAEKTDKVTDIFHSVATKYDLMNDLMSLGVHRLWKQALIRALNPQPKRHLLDVAGGTGDIAMGFLENGGGAATLLDINPAMVQAGIERSLNQGKIAGQDQNLPYYVIGTAESLPLKTQSIDLYNIAFGLRNVTYIDHALQEAHRVLKPGGQFFCMEFSPEILPAFKKLYDQYSFVLLPKIGKLVTGDEAAYQYLVESIRRFPSPKALNKRMEAAGFHSISYQKFSFGIVTLHIGWKLL